MSRGITVDVWDFNVAGSSGFKVEEGWIADYEHQTPPSSGSIYGKCRMCEGILGKLSCSRLTEDTPMQPLKRSALQQAIYKTAEVLAILILAAQYPGTKVSTFLVVGVQHTKKFKIYLLGS